MHIRKLSPSYKVIQHCITRKITVAIVTNDPAIRNSEIERALVFLLLRSKLKIRRNGMRLLVWKRTSKYTSLVWTRKRNFSGSVDNRRNVK